MAFAGHSLQWGRGFKTPEMIRTRIEMHMVALLQWGRGFKTPEIGAMTNTILKFKQLQWGRGFKTPEISLSGSAMMEPCSFNGAGVLRPRKLPLRMRPVKAFAASMGPGF